jgi:glycosyltransferase involved in cell wall biosynthesis
LIHTFHGHHLYDPNFKGVKGKILNSVERHISHRRCAHIAVGERVKRELLNIGVGSEDKFESIPPGIPEDTAADKEESQSKIGITPSKQFTVTWLGRFTAVKNPSLVNQIARKLPSVRFVMGGHGELFDQVKREAPANVYFVGWQDSKDLISASDVIISTSHSEGMPLALIESQMLGKPIISTNVGSVSEIVIDNTTGFLVPRDAESFAQKIDLIQTSTNLAEKFSSEGKIYARKHSKSSQLVNRHIELYSRVSNSI